MTACLWFHISFHTQRREYNFQNHNCFSQSWVYSVQLRVKDNLPGTGDTVIK